MNRPKLLILIGLLTISAGCNSGDFNWGKVNNLIQGSPTRIDAEYVILNAGQVDCGVQNDLWEQPSDGGGRSVARLKDKARALKFADDVSIGDMNRPYVQIRGEFTLVSVEIQADRDGPEKETKLVDVKLGVPIQHSCFPQPLPMMGVRRGNFTQDYPPVLMFRNNNGWYVDHIVH
jgi:hypothetical protein